MLALWKQLILCDLDYCSQLWNPSKTGDIQPLELFQRSYLHCINGMQRLHYWKQLGVLKLYSWERYIAIYIWHILGGHVPNFDMTPLSFQWLPRRGRECLVPRVSGTASSSFQRVHYCSLPIKGPSIFSSLPRSVRNITGCNVETFKAGLDRYLTLVPNESLILYITLLFLFSRNANSRKGTLCPFCVPIDKKKKIYTHIIASAAQVRS